MTGTEIAGIGAAATAAAGIGLGGAAATGVGFGFVATGGAGTGRGGATVRTGVTECTAATTGLAAGR